MAKRRARGDGAIYFDAVNNLWIGAIDVSADPAGRRRRAKVSGRTKTQALLKLRELRRRVDAGEPLGHDRVTVAEAVQDFLERGLPAGLASNTRYVVGLYAGRFGESCGGRRLSNVSTRDVEDFLGTLGRGGRGTADVGDRPRCRRPSARPCHSSGLATARTQRGQTYGPARGSRRGRPPDIDSGRYRGSVGRCRYRPMDTVARDRCRHGLSHW